MILCRTVADLRRVRGQLGDLAFVPTMGALHDGHVALMKVAKGLAPSAAVSIFVNPTQFGPHEDFTNYPRTLEDDLLKCESAGVNVVFAPDASEVIFEPRAVVSIPHLKDRYEGSVRPGHFDGVASIVSTLFNIVQPSVAVFGRKDLQQCAVIRTLVESLYFPVELHFAPTMREPDGLAMSSRNRYLSASARSQASRIAFELQSCARELEKQAELDLHRIVQHCENAADSLVQCGFEIDYFDAVNGKTFLPPDPQEDFDLIVAARIEGVRLIDNWEVHRRPI